MKSPQEVGSQKSEVRRRRSVGSRQKAVGGEQKEDLESLIAQAYSRGFAVHGDIELSLEAFSDHVNRIINNPRGQRSEGKGKKSEGRGQKSEVGGQRSGVGLKKNLEQQLDPATELAKLHVVDLYLASACAVTNSNAAWLRLEMLYRNYINTIARSVCPVHTEALDIANNMLSHLFLHDRQGQRRIASYQGRGPLSFWLAMIIKRLALDSADQFVLAQLRGASYRTVAINVIPSSAAGSDDYSGPTWDVVRIGEPDTSGPDSPLSNSRSFHINTSTGLIDRCFSQEGSETIVAEMTGWVDRFGENVPTRITWSRDGQPVMELNLNGVAHGSKQ